MPNVKIKLNPPNILAFLETVYSQSETEITVSNHVNLRLADRGHNRPLHIRLTTRNGSHNLIEIARDIALIEIA